MLTQEPLDVETELALGFLDYLLLGTPAAPLRKALNDSGLGAALVGGGVDDELKQPIFCVGLKVGTHWYSSYTQHAADCSLYARVMCCAAFHLAALLCKLRTTDLRQHIPAPALPEYHLVSFAAFHLHCVEHSHNAAVGKHVLAPLEPTVPASHAIRLVLVFFCLSGPLESVRAVTGFTAGAIEAAVNTIEFSLRENNTGSFPRGLSLMLRAVGAWIYGRDPYTPIQVRAVR